MKLNLGCGFNKLVGYVNVDMYDSCAPDIVANLEKVPWPFDSNSVTEVIFNHSLEHIGHSTEVFLNMMKELYRVCAADAKIQINVPHPRHDNFLGDPTHVRVITPQMLTLFSKKLNRHWQEVGAANSPLGIYLDIDFEIENLVHILEERYMALLEEKQITSQELDILSRERNNVVLEYRITLKAIK